MDFEMTPYKKLTNASANLMVADQSLLKRNQKSEQEKEKFEEEEEYEKQTIHSPIIQFVQLPATIMTYRELQLLGLPQFKNLVVKNTLGLQEGNNIRNEN